MRRLLGYLRPYWRQVVAGARGDHWSAPVVALAQPYLIKVAIDRYIAAGRAGRPGPAWPRCTSCILVVAFAAEYLQTWTMQMTGQRIMFDLRMAHLRPSAAARPALLRPQPGRPADDPRDLGRRRAERPVHLGRGHDLRRRVHAGRHHGGDAVDGLAAGAGRRSRCCRSSSLVTQWFRRNVRESYRIVRGWIARINAFLQENITGMSTVQLFRREALNFARFDDIDAQHRDANIDSIFYYAVFYPAIEAISALAIGADHLVRRRAA